MALATALAAGHAVAETPARTLPAPPSAFAAAPTEAAPRADGAWVAALGSPDIVRVVDDALAANPELRQVQARADAAKARARASAGRWLPDLSIGLSGTRTATPTGGGSRAIADSMGSRAETSWEVDLWGRVLDGVRANGADARAAEADLDAARLSIAGQAARAWVDLVAAAQLLALAEEDLATRQRAEDITQRRYAAGVADPLALRTARAQTASARAQRAAQLDARDQAARRLEAVLGRYPSAAATAGSEIPTLSALAAPGAPTELLARRPDVAAAEARLDAAGLRVWEARKALLPRITVSGSAFATGDGLKSVTDVDGLATQLIANLTLPIFQAGALRADVRAARAQARGAAYAYVETALTAWREVEDALSADASLAARESDLATAAFEAREAQALAERQYASGVATIFELIDSYTRRIDAERSLINARAARVSNRISYHVALGDPVRATAAPST